ncbi:hypothetical protein KAI65_04170 [Candidatus Parcubacteria bacterium]|nr:hypothetical protein [Candidatus Parcubacteria bacterium]
MSKKIKIESKKTETTPFVKEVAKYFMNFLETDFKKRRIPKRNTIQRTQKGLRVGIDLDKYPKFKKSLLNNFNSGFDKSQLQIKKGDFTNSIPDSLYKLLRERIKKIPVKNLSAVIKKVDEMAKENVVLYPKEYDKFLEETKEKTKYIFSKNFIIPFLNDLDKPLENLQLADENSKYQLEIEIIDFLFSLFEEKYSDILQALYNEPLKYKFVDNLNEIIKLPDIKDGLVNFFENFVIGDAFFDIYQLYRNSQLIDKTEIYLYFYELSLGNEKFPVFYIPITVEKQEDRFVFNFEKRL